jgi:hypothetical protein
MFWMLALNGVHVPQPANSPERFSTTIPFDENEAGKVYER